MPIELNTANFESVVLVSPVPVLVDFWGLNCGPCEQIAPILDQLAGELEGKAKVAKIDAHANSEIAVRYGVRTVPNLLFFKSGKVMGQLVGARITKQELREKLEALM